MTKGCILQILGRKVPGSMTFKGLCFFSPVILTAYNRVLLNYAHMSPKSKNQLLETAQSDPTKKNHFLSYFANDRAPSHSLNSVSQTFFNHIHIMG